MLKILGGIFKILWIIVKGCFNGLLNILKYYYLAVIGTCKILGISAIPNHFVASLLAIFVYVAYYVAMVIVPELIIYNTGKLTKKYKKLKTEEEKKEYLSKRALPVLKLVLTIKNALSNRQAKEDSIVIENLPTNSSNEIIESLKDELEENVEKTDDVNDDKIIENENNIKLLYTSNIIGNVLRKNIVTKRKLLNDEKPFLVDFSSVPPKEVITGNECNNIILSKNIKGKKIEILLENPELLNNPELYENLTQDELKNLKALLMQDINYQTNLKKFFAMNKKALEYKKI